MFEGTLLGVPQLSGVQDVGEKVVEEDELPTLFIPSGFSIPANIFEEARGAPLTVPLTSTTSASAVRLYVKGIIFVMAVFADAVMSNSVRR